jgi:methylmalonyl-CoA mutase N-terminal domain/subunit
VEVRVRELMDHVDSLGGAVAAIEQGYQKAEIERSAYRIAREVDTGERKVVGVNAFVTDQEEPYEPLRVDPAIEQAQAERLAELRSRRDGAAVSRRLDDVRRAAGGDENLLYPLREALRALATIGEVCDALRDVWGVYKPPEIY